RALPVPFCLYIFLPVRQISARFFTSWVPRWRLASCQTTQRWIRSVRGVSPKIASGSVIDPAFSPLRVVTVSSMSRALLGLLGGRFGRCRAFAGGAELAGFGRVLRQHFLHRVAQHDPAALRAGHRAFDQDQAALGVGLHHAQIERGDALYTHVTGHFLVLEGLARVLAATGRADRAMRDRDAVRGTQAAEVPALHAAGEAFADRRAGHVDELADHEVIGGDLGAGRNHAVGADAELGKLALGFNLGDREIAALSLADVAHLAPTGAELQRHIAVLVRGAVADDLAFVEPQHRDRHMLAGLGEEARHAHLLCDHAGAPLVLHPYSLISTSTPAARSSFISASTVCGVGSTMSSKRLWVRISNCSRLFLSMCGERLTVNFSILVGSGIGPRTCAPVRLAVATISRVEASRIRWS